MKPAYKYTRIALSLAVLLTIGSTAWAQTAPAVTYTTAQFNAYQTATTTPDPQAKIKNLETFLTQNTDATLGAFADRDLYKAYYGAKNFVKTIEYADKYMAAADKANANATDKLTALATRAQAFIQGSTDAVLQTPDALTKTRDAAAQGVTVVNALPKPANATDDAFNNQKKPALAMFNSVSGTAATYQRDWKAAITSFKAALTFNATDNSTHYNLGVAYLSDNPPQMTDGLWEFGRAIALNIAGADQKKQIMHGRVMQYQQLGCEKLADDEVNQILKLSAAGGDKPADLSIPSAQDLQAARDDTANFLPWLQEGGAHANTMWLATCGLEYPDVAVRVMEIVPGDAPDKFTLRVFQAPTTDELKAGTAPNMELHITGQPDVKKLNKDDLLRFTGTVNGYAPQPFLLTWDDCKVNSDDLQDLTTPTTTPGRPRPAPPRPGAAAPRPRGAAQ